MFRVFRSEWHDKKYDDLTKVEKERINNFEQKLKQEPYSGKPLGYKFLERRNLMEIDYYFLVYEELETVFLVTITDKRIQQEVIDLIKENLDKYKEVIEKLTKGN